MLESHANSESRLCQRRLTVSEFLLIALLLSADTPPGGPHGDALTLHALQLLYPHAPVRLLGTL